MYDLLVVADDRTGALETGGALADVGMTVEVRPLPADPSPPGGGCLVLDLGSRRFGGATERARAAVATTARRRLAHKLDSTLRGHWVEELAVLRAPAGQVLVVPAFPAAGRTCSNGVVFDHGVPVAEGPAGRDPVSPVRESRPAAQLRGGLPDCDVVELADAAEVRSWLARGVPGVAVSDARTDADLAALAAAWIPHPDVVFSGTGAAIGAVGAALTGRARVGVPPSRRRPRRWWSVGALIRQRAPRWPN